MKVEYINPFIESVADVCQSMLDMTVSRGEVLLSRGEMSPRDVMAIIGLSGPAQGTVCLSFPSGTALKMVSRLLGQEILTMDENVTDGVAEFVNIVAGGAKAKLSSSDGAPIDLGLPTVVRGNDFTIDYPSTAVWLQVPFDTDLGDFTMRVTFSFDV
jgi:chemotaxis protein CheX